MWKKRPTMSKKETQNNLQQADISIILQFGAITF